MPDEPMSPDLRAALLRVLDLGGYPEGSAQRQLHDQPDGAIAWQVQSLLDDWSDYTQVPRFKTGYGS